MQHLIVQYYNQIQRKILTQFIWNSGPSYDVEVNKWIVIVEPEKDVTECFILCSSFITKQSFNEVT